jgi:hypothetical protein
MHAFRPALRWLSAAAVSLLTLATLAAQPPDSPRPLDPLTARERHLADSVARANPRMRELLGAGVALLVDVGFVAGKPRVDSKDPDAVGTRQAAVQYFVRERNIGVTALVDLSKGGVLDVTRVRGADVPLSADEVTRAARLALADDRVRKLFDGRMPAFRLEREKGETFDTPDTAATRIDGIRLQGPKGDKCFERRCVAIFFRVDNSYVQLGRVVVDLLSDTVMVREGAR